MTAMGLDGTNCQFSLIYGVAPCDNKEEWRFCIHTLVVALDTIENSFQYIFMSNRHKVTKGLLYTAPIDVNGGSLCH